MEKSDKDLMVAYQAGDESAFNLLYKRYSKRVYGYLSQKITNPAKVDEVFQAIFLKLHQSKSQYNTDYDFSSWLFTICRTVVIDSARTRKIFDESKFTTFEERSFPAIPVDSTEKIDLDPLDPDQKEILNLRYFDEMEFKEIAVKLNLTQATVRKRVSRAIKKLRTYMGEK